MSRFIPFAVALLLLSAADDPRVMPWQKSSAPQPDALAGATIPFLPDFGAVGQSQTALGQGQSSDQAPGLNAANKGGPLDQPAELALVRFVDGEFAHAVKSLPTGKDGFILKPGQPIDEALLRRALTSHGAAMNPGDSVQITALQFKKTRIYILLNGGGKGHSSWRDRLQIGVSGVPTASATPDNNGPDRAAAGATLILDFDGPIPEMTPDALKGMLSTVLDFSHERSAAILWTQTLPPQMQKAITEKRAIVGMNREMVEAAVGKPDKKVRERNSDGDETEDWIYGQPPAITMFVTFIGDKVIRVQQFPRDHAGQR
jgi:hypothetical protein